MTGAGRGLRTVVIPALACALLAAACTTQIDASEPQTLVVQVDAAHRTGIGPFSNPTFRGSYLAYFPDAVTARPGDTVRFERVETGEPHSVTLGTLVDGEFAAAQGGLPQTLPRIPFTGQGEFPQYLAQPCYLDGEEELPGQPRERCDQPEEAPAFTGQRWYSSGFIPPDEPFDLVVGQNVQPGTYRFYCLFHGPEMSGTLQIGAPGSEIPTQAELDETAARRLDPLAESGKERVTTELERYERAGTDFPFPALAGLTLADGLVRVNEFIPFTVRARVGEPVTWAVTGTHVISFGPPTRSGPPAAERLLSGVVEYVESSVVVRRSPRPPAEPVTEPTTITAEAYGDGTHTSGVLHSPTGLITYEISFEDPGTKRYRCLIHPGMEGIVSVVL